MLCSEKSAQYIELLFNKIRGWNDPKTYRLLSWYWIAEVFLLTKSLAKVNEGSILSLSATVYEGWFGVGEFLFIYLFILHPISSFCINDSSNS